MVTRAKRLVSRCTREVSSAPDGDAVTEFPLCEFNRKLGVRTFIGECMVVLLAVGTWPSCISDILYIYIRNTRLINLM